MLPIEDFLATVSLRSILSSLKK